MAVEVVRQIANEECAKVLLSAGWQLCEIPRFNIVPFYTRAEYPELLPLMDFSVHTHELCFTKSAFGSRHCIQYICKKYVDVAVTNNVISLLQIETDRGLVVCTFYSALVTAHGQDDTWQRSA